jgi:hypothetical protein
LQWLALEHLVSGSEENREPHRSIDPREILSGYFLICRNLCRD